jgi:hypothetical protein
MKNAISLFILPLFLPALFFAQTPQHIRQAQPVRVVLMTGLGYQTLTFPNRFAFFQAEVPVNDYFRVCGRYSANFLAPSDITANFVSGSGYDVGAGLKFFAQGRFTGRKSGVFIGPELKFGVIRRTFSIFDPNTFQPSERAFSRRSWQLLFNWGTQFRFGKHTVLEIAMPFGLLYNYERTEMPQTDPGDGLKQANFIILPHLALGIAL